VPVVIIHLSLLIQNFSIVSCLLIVVGVPLALLVPSLSGTHQASLLPYIFCSANKMIPLSLQRLLRNIFRIADVSFRAKGRCGLEVVRRMDRVSKSKTNSKGFESVWYE
jgi:hypothetical protein